MKDITVIKRDGSIAPLDISEIKSMVAWATHDHCDENVGIQIEASFKEKILDGTQTKEIQKILVQCTLELCSIENPDLRYIAGRMYMIAQQKEILLKRNKYDSNLDLFSLPEYLYQDFPEIVANKIEKGIYSQELSKYSDIELAAAASYLVAKRDYDYDYAGSYYLFKRYLLEDELPQEAFLVCSLLLAVNEPSDQRLSWAIKFYEAISQRKISLATPILANLRKPNGSLTSCFITAMDDNLESIYAEVTNTARISKHGGGVGVNVSHIRATGSSLMGHKNASGGVLPWVKLLNDTAIAVNQGGRRAGAVTVGLDIWHLDVPEFLEMQTENGDQRRKAYDIFPQLVICDEFMRRVQDKQLWTLIDPYEVKQKLGIDLPKLWGREFERAYQQIEATLGDKLSLFKQVNATDLFKTIMRTQLETGMPYLAFKDTINKANPNQHDGYIPGVNLCTESYSNVESGKFAHCCNLVSLNLANLEESEIPEISYLAVRLLDNTIDITVPPIQEAKSHNDQYRVIGVGAMGLADWLAKREKKYTDLDEINQLFANIAYYCTDASKELAKSRGYYTAFIGSTWSQGLLMNAIKPCDLDTVASYKDGEILDWQNLAYEIKLYGIRNSQITAIAPNTSSSLIQGCTASILPTFSKFFYDKGGHTFPIAPPYLSQCFQYYRENKYLNQNIIVEMVATIQKWIDTGISMELIFNLNEGIYSPDKAKRITAKDIYDIQMAAWEKGCKAIYYIRTIQQDSFKEKDECLSCAN
jgi:ribonucleoside-diphosphate reductase alpha chain